MIKLDPAHWSKCRDSAGRFVNLKDPEQAQRVIGHVVTGLHSQLVPTQVGYFKIVSTDGQPACDFYRRPDGTVVVSDNIYLR